ncbi:SDR family NAD(P)-dependent oxidoreductase [Bacteroides caecigallinarum]|uniref:SDR family NAD(P)-dependent oxidoreductase n=1 Tax=Bacteroides caecigallinarum TaxID=1411144 RepID=UPI00195BE86B|nr:SDR family NAD(P)-dependent oxidoreductase [Bacteroides caecigallinarum]MBM6889525.1 SDR family NAD(P)-dependent oxidoreductase [Bacteroides caecigallinarum]MCF2553184.1 SDR family NAD(P)-dependent oxidoreductase [Bacteroides caecigallinarum]
MKYALITGASSGMGVHYTLQLAEKGYGVIIVSNRHDENIITADKVRTKFPNTDVRIIDADLTLSDIPEIIYNTVKGWNIEVDVLVSNAGMLLFSTFLKTPLTNLEKIISLHCSAPAKLIRLFGEDMATRRHGYILIVSSATAWMPFPTISHYGATKAFLKNFSRSLWYEMRRFGVGVTTVYPGAVDTPLYELSDKRRKILRKLGIMQSPEKTVSVALKYLFRKRHKCIPGIFTKITVLLCVVTPSFFLIPILNLPVVKRILDKV